MVTRPDLSRYAIVSRRAALTGALGATLLALAACDNDKSALAGASPTTPASAADPSTSTTPSASTSASPKVSGTLPKLAKLTVAFTFTPGSTDDRVHNPYVAVWVENAAGDLVKTLALWHQHLDEHDPWLKELKAFSGLDDAGSGVQAVTSATREPGSYRVQWDGSTLKGSRAAAGRYRLLIEASREHGPYELVQHDLALGSTSASFALSPHGELTQASAKYVV